MKEFIRYEQQVNTIINEACYKYIHKNGLEVYIVPKNEFKKFYVCLSTDFGGLMNNYVLWNKTECGTYPLGIAHFIEHKIFTTKDGNDASNIFENFGLDINAYTSYTNTAYYFSGNKNLYNGIDNLINFIFNPFFTKENVESEKKIINQEIKLYLDKVSTISSLGLKKNMYKNISFITDISGELKDIKNINENILLDTYYTFYNPKNMKMIIVGDVDIEQVLKVISLSLNKIVYKDIKKINYTLQKEDDLIIRKSSYKRADISIPRVVVGLKLPSIELDKNQSFILEFLLDVLLKYSIGYGSDFYQKMFDDDIVNSHYSYSVYLEAGMNYIRVIADTHNYKEFIKRIKRELLKNDIYNISENDFLLAKKAVISSYIKTFDNVVSIGEELLDSILKNIDFMNQIEILKKIKIEDLKNLQKYFREESFTTFTVLPKINK